MRAVDVLDERIANVQTIARLDAVAVSLRLTAHTPDNAGQVFLAPSMYNAAGQSVLNFAARADEMEEASVVMRNDGFAISTNEPADLTIDITGYFLRDDPNAPESPDNQQTSMGIAVLYRKLYALSQHR